MKKSMLFVLIVVMLLGTGCKNPVDLLSRGSSKSGIAVDIVEQAEIEEWKGSGEIHSLRLSVTNSPNIKNKYESHLLSLANEKIQETPYFRIREFSNKSAMKGIGEIVAPHHFLKFKITTLSLPPAKVVDGTLKRSVEIGLSATLLKSTSGDGYTLCGKKNFRDVLTVQVPEYEAASMPSGKTLIYDALDQAVDMLVRQISPKEISVFRSLRSARALEGVSTLIRLGDCEEALMDLRVLSGDVGAPGDESDMSSAVEKDGDYYYTAGLAYECLSSDSTNRDKRIRYTAKAYKSYRNAYKAGDRSEELMRAMKEVKTTLKLLQAGQDNAVKLDNVDDDLSFGGVIE
ncbi:MAG: hypothetical protein ACNI27_13065 [Desulfovibrio sp.]